MSVIGGSVGPTVNNASQITNCYLCNYSPQNILIDGVYFHDYTRTDPAKHMECLHVYPAQGITIRNSRFYNCAIMNLFFANNGSGGSLRDITLLNNMFDAPGIARRWPLGRLLPGALRAERRLDHEREHPVQLVRRVVHCQSRRLTRELERDRKRRARPGRRSVVSPRSPSCTTSSAAGSAARPTCRQTPASSTRQASTST